MSQFFKPNRDDFPEDEKGKKEYLWSLFRYTFWLVFAFVFIFGVSFVFFLQENPSHQMIDLRGRNVLEAVKWLQDHSLKPYISERIELSIPPYQVIEQNPPFGSTVKENRIVSLVVSYGGNRLVMPTYRGISYNQAYQSLLAYLSGYGTLPQVTRVDKYSDLPEGMVVDHYPRYNQPINFQERIIFVVSRGAVTNRLIAENYISQNFFEVEEKLLSYGIRVIAEHVLSEDFSLAGKIVDQDVSPKTELQPGSLIRFTVGFFDSQATKSLESERSKVEVIRLYRLQVPIQSSLNDFTRNLENDQEVYFAPSNQDNDPTEKTSSVIIEVNDQLGKRVLFNEVLRSGEEINIPYRTIGNGVLKILVNGEVFDTVTFN